MPPGPKPKPTKLKELEGNPGKRPLPKNEPHLSGKLPSPPKDLSPEAKKVFRDICKKMPEGVFGEIDVFLIAKFSVAWDFYIQAYAAARKGGPVVKSKDGNPYQNPFLSVMNRQAEIMNRLGARMGFSPSDRTRLCVEGEKKVDDAISRVEAAKREIEESRMRRVK